MTHEISVVLERFFIYVIILICGFTGVVSIYEFIAYFIANPGGISPRHATTDETTLQRIVYNMKCSNLKLEYLARPIYARQTFLFLVFIASSIRLLFLLLQILLPDGLFYLNYLVIIPSICYYSLYTILSCYFHQLYILYYVTSSNTASSTSSSQSISSSISSSASASRANTYTSRIAQISSYFQYTLILFIPILYIICIVVYSSKAISIQLRIGSNSSTTITTTSDGDINFFQWIYILFRFILLFSLLYAGCLIYMKIYTIASYTSSSSSSANTGVSIGNPKATESQVVVKRLLIILSSAAFGIMMSIIYGIINITGRYEDWPLIKDVVMYALSEILPTFIILLHISKLKFTLTLTPASSAAPSSASSSLNLTGMNMNQASSSLIQSSSSKPANGHSGYGSMMTSTLPTGTTRLLPSLNRSAISGPAYQPIPTSQA